MKPIGIMYNIHNRNKLTKFFEIIKITINKKIMELMNM